MSETIVEFENIREALEPAFAGRSIRIVWENGGATLSVAQREGKRLRARGIGHEHANPAMIPSEGEAAWAEAAVEKHKRRQANERDNP